MADETTIDETAEQSASETLAVDETVASEQDSDGLPFDINTIVELPNGEQVTFAELQNGYLRQGDYTKKTQELAEQRKALDAMASKLTQDHPQQEVGGGALFPNRLNPSDFEFDSDRQIVSAINAQQDFFTGAIRELLDLVEPALGAYQSDQTTRKEIDEVSRLVGESVSAHDIAEAKRLTGQDNACIAVLLARQAVKATPKKPATPKGDSSPEYGSASSMSTQELIEFTRKKFG